MEAPNINKYLPALAIAGLVVLALVFVTPDRSVNVTVQAPAAAPAAVASAPVVACEDFDANGTVECVDGNTGQTVGAPVTTSTVPAPVGAPTPTADPDLPPLIPAPAEVVESIAADDECVMLAGHVDDDPDGVPRLIRETETGSLDYVGGKPGEWVAESGDGQIIGYAMQEDAAIWNTRECALSNG